MSRPGSLADLLLVGFPLVGVAELVAPDTRRGGHGLPGSCHLAAEAAA